MTVLLSIFSLLGYILWDVSPEISPNISFGITIRYYGILFALGFFLGQLLLTRIFKTEGKPEKDIESITMYMLVATILGARLGHCLFYEPEYYLSNPLEILMVWKGGLASHGAAVGILTAIFLYSRKRPDQNYLWVLDRIAIMVALAGALIRTGNLMNSEIIGNPTQMPWAVEFVHGSREAIEVSFETILERLEITKANKDTMVNGQTLSELRYHFQFEPYKFSAESVPSFLQVHLPTVLSRFEDSRDNVVLLPNSLKPVVHVNEKGQVEVTASIYAIPRHPAQVYEAISTFLLFLLLLFLWIRYKSALPEGRSFGLFMLVLFTLRFGYEFLKKNQVEFEDSLTFNMGQMLSIPMLLVGAWVFWRSFQTKNGQNLNK